MSHTTAMAEKTSEFQETALQQEKISPAKRRLWFIPWIIGLVAVLAMEIGFFNLGFWRTHNLTPVSTGTPVIGEGLKSLGHNRYKITKPAQATVTVPVQSTNAGSPVVVGSIRVIPGDPDDGAYERQTVAVSIKPVAGETSRVTEEDLNAKDKNQIQRKLNVNEDGIVYPKDEWVDARDSDGGWSDTNHLLTYGSSAPSQFFLFGKTLYTYHAQEVRLTFQGHKNDTVYFESLQVNPTIPFKINMPRVVVEIAVALFFIAFRPSSRMYSLRLKRHDRLQITATVVFVAGWSLMLAFIAKRTQLVEYRNMGDFLHWLDTEQYQRLADALLHGHAWLDLPVDDSLTTMSNPYSYQDRHLLAQSGDHQFFWDHAYHDGHYYCYFGVVPALLTFVPYQLLTGHWMPTWMAIAFFCAVATVFGTLLVQRIARDYFPNASLGMVWLAIFGLNLGTGLFQYVHKTDFYGIPMTASLALTFTALWFWMCSKREDGTVQPALVLVGSTLMALNLGTRPQFLACWVLAFPIFWQQIVHKRTLFSKESIGVTCAAVLPFVCVAIPLLWYNYIRFGSIFDFGQNYNLTIYDLTSRQASPYNLPILLFNQLFEPIATTGQFPFLRIVDTQVGAPNEASIGGFFALAPFACFALLTFLVRKRLHARHIWGVSATSIILAAIVVIGDSYKSGSTMRYYGDFAYLLLLSAILTLFAFESLAQGDSDKALSEVPATGSDTVAFRTLATVTVTTVALGVAITFLGLFVFGRYNGWDGILPNLYESIKSWFIGLTA